MPTIIIQALATYLQEIKCHHIDHEIWNPPPEHYLFFTYKNSRYSLKITNTTNIELSILLKNYAYQSPTPSYTKTLITTDLNHPNSLQQIQEFLDQESLNPIT